MATTQTRPDPPHSGSAADPAGTEAPLHALRGAWWKWGCGLLMTYVIYGAFFIAKGAINFTGDGNIARIVFFHVPVAALSSVWYIVAAVYALRYLFSARDRSLDTDAKSAIAMELGLLYCLLATLTGSVFAAAQWGSYWNWDPRETSIVIMLLLYAAYLILRGAVREQPTKRAMLSAVYALVVWVPAMFLIWVVPRIPALASLHPPDTLLKLDKTSFSYKIVLYPSFLAFTLLFLWLFQLRYRLYKITARRGDC